MNVTTYTHEELVLAVWHKTLTEIDQNPSLAHHTEQSLLRCVAMVLTPDGVHSLIREKPELRAQFARTVARWRTETKQQRGSSNAND